MAAGPGAGASVSPAPRRLSILGATGSIGLNTLDLVAAEPGRFAIETLTAGRNARQLAELAIRFSARVAVVADAAAYAELRDRLAGTGIEAAAGAEAVADAAARPTDIVVSAIVGFAGLAPSLAALGATPVLALANKETLVSAGPLFLAAAQRAGTRILPVDSEHNAIFQVFEAGNADTVSEVIVTASGGPFLRTPKSELAAVTRDMALRHPKWRMGPKITIDSATLMNKGLELIEAYRLYPVSVDQLSVLVHPQSVVHGLVRYRDGSLLAELGVPDMRTPIGYCLAWPERRPTTVKPLDLSAIGSLTFEAPDRDRFPCLPLAEAAMRRGDGAPCVLNAANEVAVEAFLAGQIGFLDIARVVEATLGKIDGEGGLSEPDSLAAATELDGRARKIASACL
ncbi:1-deoxy-D-xylulose-5-phosphate reductoisomerase [Pleomorphomonas carboxyditropha]|uniref:1-deoxy-D-xylulose 5-phosphate reductoisomerase n=1 Tax=Pleomorphomonas carboxyditropha TaxID=2023338 RepID=A0A2G9WZJ5_9HYPH|nr:1-deoxy-D-xylulose-5-phosphate reductoisomerase [Pleomorphomonas carboxyditropha]PIO99520.1 1-deoxy-D-xylulose-5-phosphate reductoisomerase [Pleomorphomonas carboxyditropha]